MTSLTHTMNTTPTTNNTTATNAPNGGTPLATLRAHGQSIWLDSLSRSLLESGELARLVAEDGISGVTSNPTIFQKALAEGSAYDAQLEQVLRRSQRVSDKEIFLELAGEDVRRACTLLLPTWSSTNGADGYASWEVDPNLADDREATVLEARALHRRIAMENLFVKIPATSAGIGAIEDAVAAGLNINVTLIFSLQRHAEVMEAYLRGLERFAAQGGDVARVRSVASFFVSRVDTEADKRLAALGRHGLQGRLAVANAKLAYQRYLEVFDGPRWDALAQRGAHAQPCLWASTSMKDPSRRDVFYVEQLIGRNTVNTMPRETIDAFREHGVVNDTLELGVEQARLVLDDVRDAGVDYANVCAQLEREGVSKFVDSFEALLRGIRAKRASAEPHQTTSVR